MKNIFTIVICLLITFPLFAQRRMGGKDERPEIRERLEQFEKVRLLEMLSLDEETAVKFIMRRKKHRTSMHSIMDKRHETMAELDQNIRSGSISDEKIKKLISDLIKIEKELAEERETFVESLYDILTVEQVGKVITFEHHFRDDVKGMIEQRGRPKPEFE